jgi:hypothetical protein
MIPMCKACSNLSNYQKDIQGKKHSVASGDAGREDGSNQLCPACRLCPSMNRILCQIDVSEPELSHTCTSSADEHLQVKWAQAQAMGAGNRLLKGLLDERHVGNVPTRLATI